MQRRRKAARAEMQRQVAALKGSRPPKRRRWRWVLLVLLLVLIAILQDCRCTEPVEPPPVESVSAPPLVPGPAISTPAPPAPGGRVERRDRPAYAVEAPEPLPWLSAFRMQVAARGPRLAECFVGIEHPGALRWTTSVEPGEGRVSEHSLEPVLSGQELSRAQRACLLGVLSEPPYQLQAGEGRATPSRVGLVIEF